MEEIKRARVPFPRTAQARTQETAEARATQAADEAKRAARARAKKRPRLDNTGAVAFRGNALTGAALDGRKDLPPKFSNLPPKTAMANRAARLAATYAKPV